MRLAEPQTSENGALHLSIEACFVLAFLMVFSILSIMSGARSGDLKVVLLMGSITAACLLVGALILMSEKVVGAHPNKTLVLGSKAQPSPSPTQVSLPSIACGLLEPFKGTETP